MNLTTPHSEGIAPGSTTRRHRDRAHPDAPYLEGAEREVLDREEDLAKEEARFERRWLISVEKDDGHIERTIKGDVDSIVAQIETERLKRLVITAPSGSLETADRDRPGREAWMGPAVVASIAGDSDEWVRATRDRLDQRLKEYRQQWDWVRAPLISGLVVGLALLAGGGLGRYLLRVSGESPSTGAEITAMLIWGAVLATLSASLWAGLLSWWPPFEILRAGARPRAVAAIAAFTFVVVPLLLAAGLSVVAGV